nr:hypothetical protein [Tanacetum cinerariifolium]
LTTLEGVNTRVTKLAAVQEQDTHDIYGVMEDAQRRQTQMFQRVETLVDDSRYHYETGRLVDQEARCSRDAWAHSIGLSSADEEPFKDEEEEHLAPADSPDVLIINLVPLADDTEAFKTDESALTPLPSPRRVDILAEDRQFHYETARLMDQEALVSREAWAQSIGLSSAVHYELQAYRIHTQMQDYRIASQESLMTTLIAHVSSLQGQLSAASGQIQTLQARGQTHADDHEGISSSA